MNATAGPMDGVRVTESLLRKPYRYGFGLGGCGIGFGSGGALGGRGGG